MNYARLNGFQHPVFNYDSEIYNSFLFLSGIRRCDMLLNNSKITHIFKQLFKFYQKC